jgi:hypothetical protein
MTNRIPRQWCAAEIVGFGSLFAFTTESIEAFQSCFRCWRCYCPAEARKRCHPAGSSTKSFRICSGKKFSPNRTDRKDNDLPAAR